MFLGPKNVKTFLRKQMLFEFIFFKEDKKMNNISTRGRTFTGTVVSNKMTKTVTVEWTRKHYIPKYERYETRRTRVKAHDETEAEIGDTVIIKETRPLSKTKNFVVIKNLKASKLNTVKSEDVDASEETPKKKAVAKKAPAKVKAEKTVEAEK